MKRIVKQLICMSLAVMIMFANCVNIAAAKKDKDVSYSEIMADEVETGAANDKKSENIDVEAEEIFGGGTASTTIDSSTKKQDTSKKDNDKTAVDDTPKTGIEDTSIFIPVALLLVAAVAMAIAGVNKFGRKRFNTAE